MLKPYDASTGGCVYDTRPEQLNDGVQCSVCKAWWHQQSTAVAKTSERQWNCNYCLQKSRKHAHIAIQLQKIDEERAIQQREMEAEKRALAAERKAMVEKYKLLERQLLGASYDVSHQNRLSRRSRQKCLHQWDEQQSPKNTTSEEEARKFPSEVDGQDKRDQVAIVSKGGREIKRTKKISDESSSISLILGKNIALMDSSADKTDLKGTQQRRTSAISKTVSNARVHVEYSRATDGNLNFSTKQDEPLAKHHLRSVTNSNSSSIQMGQDRSEYDSSAVQIGVHFYVTRDASFFKGIPTDWLLFIREFVSTTAAFRYSNMNFQPISHWLSKGIMEYYILRTRFKWNPKMSNNRSGSFRGYEIGRRYIQEITAEANYDIATIPTASTNIRTSGYKGNQSIRT